MLRFKPGVSLKDMVPQMVVALMVAEGVLAQLCGPQVDLVVTSANDGEHMEGSYHYQGRAVDLRTQHTGMGKQLCDELRKALGPLGFDVVYEDPDGPNQHAHLELDKRAGY